MSLLTIDKDNCAQDGLCAAECPANIILFKGKNSYPELVPDGETMCLECGHCVAVCPHGALDHAGVPLASCPEIDTTVALSEAHIEQFLRSRRSVRRFKDKAVQPATLQRVIEIARYSPTGSNSQRVEWMVINDKDRLHALSAHVIDWMRGILKADPKSAAMPYLPRMIQAWEAGKDAVLRGAPCLVVAIAPEQARSGMVDLALALSYLELAAPAFGLGTCWAGLLQGAVLSNPGLKATLGIPDDYPHHYPMMIGYSKAKYYRLPERKAPKIWWK
jgi:nitroreductase/NAD-dependent dihydropyrimidine dehydrogenase PreA subunit